MIQLVGYYINHTGDGDETKVKLAIPKTDGQGHDQTDAGTLFARTKGKHLRITIEEAAQ